ncbi:NAD(P)/FAD-dependent oxidoreductase [Carboxylicivirga sp. N1Y90]|uniref:NAD(P)/FAD-dependent oxidoreductase n=1 Tax=Carboxylicivirga fragile TaxID=3417571 RepID=UPI003D32A82F|nr:FAD-binding oxidoreductase [Marinilabiliaceae bacterium N1Y90]
MKEKERIIIVGAGLAGICLAYQLSKRHVPVTIIDKGKNWSSKIAAGLITPLVFRRMTKSWMVDDVMEYLIPFYTQLEEETSSKLLIPLNIRRLFSSEQERGYWLKKQEQNEFKPYMHSINKDDETYNLAKNPYGSARVKSAYCVDVATFFKKMEAWLKSNANFLRQDFDYTKIEADNYKGITYSKIIFCEGFEVRNNPFFKELPVDPTKGQTLKVEMEGIPEHESLNRKCFILPLGKQQFRIGATYEWHNISTNTTDEAREELLRNLKYITDIEPKIITQEAGVRPTVKDRRPIMGQHKSEKKLYIFNGLGAKGYMLVPLLGKQFCDYLLNHAPLNPELNIQRFYLKQ